MYQGVLMKLPIRPRSPSNARGFVLAIFFSALATTSAFAQRPTITVSASPPLITNQGDDAILTLTASTPPARDLLVNFFVTGTAVIGLDYLLLDPNRTPAIIRGLPQIIFPAGQSSVDITLHTLVHDTGPGLFVTAQFFVERGRRYRVGHPDRAFVRIENLK